MPRLRVHYACDHCGAIEQSLDLPEPCDCID